MAYLKDATPDEIYDLKLNYLVNNKPTLYKQYGSTDYNRYLNYYTTKVNLKKYNIDQNTIAPNYSQLDDLITNRAQYESKYGKSGYNTLYSQVYNINKDEINSLNDAISLKEKGAYSYDILPETWKAKFQYTTDTQDQLRKKAGIVPKAFEKNAKQIVADAKGLFPEQIESDITSQYGSSYLDKYNTEEEKPITVEELKRAIDILDYYDTYGKAPDNYSETPSTTTNTQNTQATAQPRTSAAQNTTTQTQTNENLLNIDTNATQNRINELETQIKTLDEELKHPSVDNTYLQIKAKRDEVTKELTNLKSEIKSVQYADEINKYNLLTQNSDFSDYAKQGESKGNILKEINSAFIPEDFKKRFDYITDDEKKIYYYLLGKEGEESSKKYLKTLMETLNYRYGTEIANNTKGFFGTAGMAVNSGLDQFIQNASQLFTGETLATSPTQYASSQVRQNLDGIGGIAYDATQSIANMTPSILLSSLVTAASGGLGAAPALATTLGQASGSVLMGATSAAGAYNQAVKQGYTKDQALAYGLLDGTLEGGLQYLLGGVSKLGGKLTSNVAANAISKIDNVALKIAADFGISAFGEASEEYLQEILNPVIRNITLDENNEFKPFTEEALYNAMLGALTSGVFKGAEIAGNKLSQIKNNIGNQTDLNTNITKPTAEQAIEQPITETQPTTEQLTFEQPTNEVIQPVTEQPKKIPTLKEVLQAEKVKSNIQPNTTINTNGIEQAAYQENGTIEAKQPLNEARYKKVASETVSKTIDENPTLRNVQHVEAVKGRATRYLSDTDGNINYSEKAMQWVKDNATKIEDGESIDTSMIVAGETLINMARENGDTTTEQNINALVSLAKSQYGSNLAILRWLNSNTSDGYLKVLEHKFNGLTRLILNKYGKFKANGINKNGVRVNDGILAVSENIKAQAYNEAKALWTNGKPTAEQLSEFNKQIAYKLSESLPVTTKEKFNAYRYMAMLGNPLTGASNTTSNAVEALLTWVDRQFQAAGERMFKVDKENQQHTFGFKNFNENSPEMQAIHKSSETIGRQHYEVHDKFDITNPTLARETTFKKHNIKDQQGIGKAVSVAKNIPQWYEKATKTIISDWMAWKYQYESSLAQIMKVRGLSEVTPDIENVAIEKADRATYRIQNKVTKAFNRWKNKRGFVGALTTATVPFSTAPVNLAMTAVDRSFFGGIKNLVKAVTVDAKPVREAQTDVTILETKLSEAQQKGKPTKSLETQLESAKKSLYAEKQSALQKKIDGFSRNITGLVVPTALGFLLSSMGLVVTRFSDNKEEREFAEANGMKEYSIKIPNGNGYTYIPINQLTTLSLGLFSGAEIYNAITNKEDTQTDLFGRMLDASVNAIQGSYETFSDLTMVSNLVETGRKIFDSTAGRGYTNIAEPILDIAYNYLIGQNTPSILRTVSNIVDPTVVKTTGRNIFESKLMQTLAKVGLKSALPTDVDIWGRKNELGAFGKIIPKEQQTFDDLIWRFAQNTVIPSKISTADTDPVNTEILRLSQSKEIDSIGTALPTAKTDLKITNSAAKKKFGSDGLKISPEQLSKLKQDAGSMTYRVVKKVINSSEYKLKSDKDKAKALSDIYTEIWTYFQNNLVKQTELPSIIKK